MTPSTKLGGFKILKDVDRISLVIPNESEHLPAQLCRVIADEEINLPYVTCINIRNSWGMNLIVDSFNGDKMTHLIEGVFGKRYTLESRCAILSIFPHKRNPEISGSLFEAFSHGSVEPNALANSPSAICAVLKEEALGRVSDALFGTFSFSAYRTPADWKLAQKGKEQLYKEVVASYQEKRPKVYGLEYQDHHELLYAILNKASVGQLASTFKELARLGLHLSFLVTGPCQDEGKDALAFCLPISEACANSEIVKRSTSEVVVESLSPVALFFMNGPHFGDRYGIASELLSVLDRNRVDLLALNCTVASIIGVVPSRQIETAIQAIEESFEVPSTTKRDRFSP